MRLDLRARGRANEHVTVFAHKRQPGAYHGHMVGRERLWTNADVDSTIGAAPDFVAACFPGRGSKALLKLSPRESRRPCAHAVFVALLLS